MYEVSKLKVLIVEDNLFDAELIARALKQAGIDSDWERVDTESDFLARLSPDLDLILSDYGMPQFSGLEALRIVRARGLDTAFILVSGSIGEDMAVAAMHYGADDYLLKDRIARLGPAVLQALQKRRLQQENRRFLDSLMESEERFRQITENIREVFWLADAASRELLYVSPGYDLIWGRSRDELRISPGLWLEAVHVHDRDRVKQAVFNQHIPGARDLQYRVVRPDGSVRWIEDRAFPVRDASGNIYRVAGVAEDITEQRQAETKIHGLNRVYAMLSGINNAIARLTDRQRLYEEACRIAVEHGDFGIAWIGQFNAECMEIVPVAAAGLELDSMLRHTAISLRPGVTSEVNVVPRAFYERRPVVDNDIAASPQGGRRRQEAIRRGYRSVITLPLMIAGNSVATFSLFAKEPGFFDEEEISLLTELAANISFALQSFAEREKVEYLSYYDPLTGLPNRTLFVDRAQNQMRARGGEQLFIALVLLDIERFRHINESFGRHGGDQLLKLVAQRLESALRGKEHLARVGADGFGFLIRGVRDSVGVVHAVERQLLSCFEEPFIIHEATVRVAARAGIALFPTDAAQADVLFNNAEAALKRAKTTSERYLFYAAEMNARAAQLLSLETRLRTAGRERQFV
ncbi:MAG: diguanylate cyclase domain-containing protein, partial [Burkholderiales bacterium]